MTTATFDVRTDLESSEPPRREHSGPSLATLLKYLVFGGLGVAVILYIGPGEIAAMLVKILVALAISLALFVGATVLSLN